MRLLCWSIVCVLALGACGSKGPANAGASEQQGDQWVCQPDGDAWECDQGAEPPSDSPGQAATDSARFDAGGDEPALAGDRPARLTEAG